MAAKIALTQRSLARESVGGVAGLTSSKSEKVSMSGVSEAVSLFNVLDAGRVLRRFRWPQQTKLIWMKLNVYSGMDVF